MACWAARSKRLGLPDRGVLFNDDLAGVLLLLRRGAREILFEGRTSA
jgi:hypothetical protein